MAEYLTAEPGPAVRLIRARSRLRLANLAIMAGEAQAGMTDSWAGSEGARAGYAELTAAARELVAAQEAFDALAVAERARMNLPGDTGKEAGDG